MKDLKHYRTYYLPIKIFVDDEGMYYAEIGSAEGLDYDMVFAIKMALNNFVRYTSGSKILSYLVLAEG